jgi:hypothetical protein
MLPAPRRPRSTLLRTPLARAGVEAEPLPAFYYALDADVQALIKLPLQKFVNEKEQVIKSIERVIKEKDECFELVINVKDDTKKYMQQLLDSKDVSIKDKEQLLQLAADREAGLIRQVANIHAVHSPRVVVYSILQACAIGSPRLPVGPGDVSDFVNKFVYEKGRGLGEANHNRRNFTAAAAAFVQEIGTSDVEGIHQALGKLFQTLSRPHHTACQTLPTSRVSCLADHTALSGEGGVRNGDRVGPARRAETHREKPD